LPQEALPSLALEGNAKKCRKSEKSLVNENEFLKLHLRSAFGIQSTPLRIMYRCLLTYEANRYLRSVIQISYFHATVNKLKLHDNHFRIFCNGKQNSKRISESQRLCSFLNKSDYHIRFILLSNMLILANQISEESADHNSDDNFRNI